MALAFLFLWPFHVHIILLGIILLDKMEGHWSHNKDVLVRVMELLWGSGMGIPIFWY